MPAAAGTNENETPAPKHIDRIVTIAKASDDDRPLSAPVDYRQAKSA
jgi:hypothetical protein